MPVIGSVGAPQIQEHRTPPGRCPSNAADHAGGHVSPVSPVRCANSGLFRGPRQIEETGAGRGESAGVDVKEKTQRSASKSTCSVSHPAGSAPSAAAPTSAVPIPWRRRRDRQPSRPGSRRARGRPRRRWRSRRVGHRFERRPIRDCGARRVDFRSIRRRYTGGCRNAAAWDWSLGFVPPQTVLARRRRCSRVGNVRSG